MPVDGRISTAFEEPSSQCVVLVRSDFLGGSDGAYGAVVVQLGSDHPDMRCVGSAGAWLLDEIWWLVGVAAFDLGIAGCLFLGWLD